MNIYLKQLTINDGEKEYEYLKNLPEYENGFFNPASMDDLLNEETYKAWLIQRDNESKGINLIDGYVPQTIYWVMLDDEIVGIGKIRHYLNEFLLKEGGHIGLGISSKCRSKGVGTQALLLLLEKAAELNIDRVLFTNNVDNKASRRIVEKCGAVLESIDDGKCKYWKTLEVKLDR